MVPAPRSLDAAPGPRRGNGTQMSDRYLYGGIAAATIVLVIVLLILFF